jgi:hypothetical protein
MLRFGYPPSTDVVPDSQDWVARPVMFFDPKGPFGYSPSATLNLQRLSGTLIVTTRRGAAHGSGALVSVQSDGSVLTRLTVALTALGP